MNLVNQDDRNNMWLPLYDEQNVRDHTKVLLSDEDEILKIIPQENFNFVLNSYTDYSNARLFEVK